MRICIVIKSDAFRSSAGMRIRYDRFAECLVDGDTIEAQTCSDLAALPTLDYDVYIFCKTFDMASALFARRVRARGAIVGQDLFDDYFSQSDDPRLEEYRDWLRMMAPVTDFAICSTPRMVEVARPYMPGIPIVAVDDPVFGYDPLVIGAMSDAKTRRSLNARTLDVAWFGIGDNPYFPVGVTDLAAFESELARIERRGWTVRLKLVTNSRPFEKTGLAALRAFSIAHEVIEWTEETERAVLLDAVVSVLPVNAQSFSRAKSLNRAITAINAGCQVLSLGFPLYDRIDDFLYRSADALVDDIEAGRCRLGSKHMTALTAILSEIANPFESASTFVGEARRAMERLSDRPRPPLTCVVHGRQSSMAVHKAMKPIDGLSISTPFCSNGWNFPVRFDLAGGRLKMRAATTIAERFGLPRVGSRIFRIRDLEFVEIDQEALGVAPLRVYQPLRDTALRDVALYEELTGQIERCCRAAFGEIEFLLSDASPLKRVARPRAEAA